MKTKKRHALVGAAVLLAAVIVVFITMEAQGSWRRCGGWPRGGPGAREVGEFMMWRMDKMADELKLNAGQKEKFGKLRAGIQSHFGEAMKDRGVLRDEIRAEMGKEIPDVAAVSLKAKKAIQGMSASVQESMDLFAAFYSSLDNDQKKKVAGAIQERMAQHSPPWK